MIPISLLIILLSAIPLEFFTHFVEKAAGAHLNWRNAERTPWGTYWEKESLSREAAKKVYKETSEIANLQRKAELVLSFSELIRIAPENVGIPLTPAKFLELYYNFPSGLQDVLIENTDLEKLFWTSPWQRCSVWRKGNGAMIYFIDDRNRVTQDIEVSKFLIEASTHYGQEVTGRLENDDSFLHRIYISSKFFGLFFEWSPEDRARYFPEKGVLNHLEKPITQVGFKPASEEGEFAIIAFESFGSNGYFYKIYPVDQRLTAKLLHQLNLSNDAVD